MKKNIIQNALNRLDKRFRPKRTERISYVQPQKRNGRIEYIQPKKN
jgi:hypothetical protein